MNYLFKNFIEMTSVLDAETVMAMTVITSLVSILIAVVALSYSIIQGWQNQKHNRLSLRPLLGADLLTEKAKNNNKRIKFELVNHGVGPAIIKKIVLFCDGKKVVCNSAKEYHNFMKEKLNGIKPLETAFVVPCSVMQTRDRLSIWDIEYNPENDDIDFIYKLNLRIEYESVYQDYCYVYDTKDDIKFNEKKPDKKSPCDLSYVARTLANIHADCFTIPRPWTAQKFACLLKKQDVSHIKDENCFVIWQRLNTEQTELLSIAVKPKQRGKGKGRDLLNKVIADAKSNGDKSILLEVAKNNAPALHLYKSVGFKKAGVRHAYYKVPDAPSIDAVLMRLDLMDSSLT
ncbi:MAG: GNAT family N-acetyltransferase [Proteobacteria bacterium]|nr:GNAT family N-acetyltransferase [Pseudomonadota bacterium]